MTPANLSNGYKVILVDEAQDLTPGISYYSHSLLKIICIFLAAIIDILSHQKIAKVFVGDPNQQIYSFRGATNALNQITATHTYSLTRVSMQEKYYNMIINFHVHQ